MGDFSYKVIPHPSGQRVKVATDNRTGQIVDVIPLVPRALRSKATKRKKVKR